MGLSQVMAPSRGREGAADSAGASSQTAMGPRLNLAAAELGLRLPQGQGTSRTSSSFLWKAWLAGPRERCSEWWEHSGVSEKQRKGPCSSALLSESSGRSGPGWARREQTAHPLLQLRASGEAFPQGWGPQDCLVGGRPFSGQTRVLVLSSDGAVGARGPTFRQMGHTATPTRDESQVQATAGSAGF